MALRLADRLTGDTPTVDEAFYAALRRHFSDDEILDLGMTVTFASGWQRFIEAFGVVPDHWRDGSPPPWGGEPPGPPTPPAPRAPPRTPRPAPANARPVAVPARADSDSRDHHHAP